MIYSLGYQNLTPAKLARLVKRLDALLIDVRSSPRSRKPGFGGRQLEALLPGRYRHEPGLGGRAPIDLDRVRAIREAHDGAARPNAILLCLEELPSDCHRHTAICRPHLPGALHVLAGCCFSVEGIQRFMDSGELPEPVDYIV